MRKLTRILPLAFALLLVSCQNKSETAAPSGSAPSAPVEDATDKNGEVVQPYKPEQAPAVQAVEPVAPPKPAPAKTPKHQDARQAAPRESQNQPSSPKVKNPYDSEFRLRLEHLDEEASQTRARIDAITARREEFKRQGMQESPDFQLALVTAFNELSDILNEQIALAIRLGDDSLEQEYRAQLNAAQKELTKING